MRNIVRAELQGQGEAYEMRRCDRTKRVATYQRRAQSRWNAVDPGGDPFLHRRPIIAA
jgi:hypothetical protein